MRSIALPALTVILAFLAFSAARMDATPPKLPPQTAEPPLAEPAAIDGVYELHGHDGEKAYAGIAIIRRADGAYLVQWMPVGWTPYSGIALRAGDTLSVAWSTNTGKTLGVNTYRIAGKRLQGRWTTLPGNGVAHPETLTWIRDVPEPKGPKGE